jgi:hypothetical protein
LFLPYHNFTLISFGIFLLAFSLTKINSQQYNEHQAVPIGALCSNKQTNKQTNWISFLFYGLPQLISTPTFELIVGATS